MYEKPSRQACDRCHDLKLRCHRNDVGKCRRCTRASASCVFSPSNRGRRSTHQNRRAGSQVTKWASDGQSNVKLAPRVPEEVISDLENVETRNEEYSNGHHHIQPRPRIFEYTPISSAEIREPTMPNLCVGVDPDVTLLESFTPSMSLLGVPLESNFFSRFSHHDDNTLSQITDPHLSLLEPFSGLHMPDVVPTANEIRPDITQAPSQQSDVPHALDCHRKINPQTRVLQQFTEDILELDIDLIRHTLEDPVAFDSAQTTPGSDSTSTSNPLSNCPVDTTLVLTQRMIKLFSRGGNWTTQSSVPQKSPISTSSSFSSRFEQLITENAPTSTSRYPDLDPQQEEMNLDQTSILHALSTYMRLIEAYHLTFSQTTQKFGVALSEGSSIPLPSLQIGAFAMDDPAGHVALVIQSALQLLDRLGDLVNKLTMPFLAREDGDNVISSSPTPPTGHNVINMVMTTVRERESQLMKAAVGLESCCREARRPREGCS